MQFLRNYLFYFVIYLIYNILKNGFTPLEINNNLPVKEAEMVFHMENTIC